MKANKERRLPNFYYDGGQESQTAKELLDQYDIQYLLIQYPRPTEICDEDIVPPAIISGHGWFQNLGGIKSYIEFICELDKPL